ncbi:acyl-CoA dehydrogenase family protein [Actinophytocola gossypii]|uniref:Acyl-CoA dehydrogenase family protein n=1 Tax=Actinophytocola gossypii TaxID=2812003 RepID=A0ABT2J275_9PSEU|nr:acyl-CoA dehydrogenase family protein [Actinophytocola gossypii]MCT2581866.1 acyl-CoA dehydrogenase family protein [Actinophytocola gossypii]
MDLRYSSAAEKFRREIRRWLAESVPAEWRRPGFWIGLDGGDESVDLRRRWERSRFENGFAGVDWPVEFGGRGADQEFRAVHDEEMARARAPIGPFLGLTYLGTTLLGPTLLRYGTEEQKRRLLPSILSGATIWCQGFSEPESGSDLASLSTTARRDGDDLVVSGQKVWTSMAGVADALFALVRTDPAAERHRGITFLLIDLTLPGVEVRPIRQMSGSWEFGQEFLDDVRVPVSGNVVGRIDDGWTVAGYLLSVERNASPVSHYAEFRHELDDVVAAAKVIRKDGRPAVEHPSIRAGIARCRADLELLRVRGYHTMTRVARGEDLGAEASVTKLLWSRTRLAIADLGADVLAAGGQRGAGEAFAHLRWRHLHVRGQRIAGGTAQIQRTIVARQLLDLPR